MSVEPTDVPAPAVPVAQTKLWDRAGVEFEGGFCDPVGDVARRYRGAQGKHDASVHCGNDSRRPGVIRNIYDQEGEVITPPIGSLEELHRATDLLFPDAMNQSAGMHVHVSFLDDEHYRRLTSRAFWKYFLDQWEAWGNAEANKSRMLGGPTGERATFLARWKGTTHYCQRNGKRDEGDNTYNMANGGGGDRYRQLNYCKTEHNTIECRMLPMFKDITLAKDAMTKLLSIYQDFLHMPDTTDRLELSTHRNGAKLLGSGTAKQKNHDSKLRKGGFVLTTTTKVSLKAPGKLPKGAVQGVRLSNGRIITQMEH